jgi:hypothetical protein
LQNAGVRSQLSSRILQLPPLILHPFSGGAETSQLIDGSRAALALEGLADSSDEEAVLRQRMLAGRYQEVRMLLFLGKDLFRWMQQCVEHVRRGPGQDDRQREKDKDKDVRIVEQSFAAMVVEAPPDSVRLKLEGWGVTDRKGVFSRAIGIHSLFQAPPPVDSLSPIFLKNYHRYADYAYICYQHSAAFLPLEASICHFEIYASEEYARLLSAGWSTEP